MSPSLDLMIIWTAVLLGLRHSLDVDHLAAITDIAGTQSTRRGAFWGCAAYALGHAGIVLVLGGFALLLGLKVPEAFGWVMGKIVGVTLLVLSVAITVSALRTRNQGKIVSRWRILYSWVSRLLPGNRQTESPAVASGSQSSGANHGHPRTDPGTGALSGPNQSGPGRAGGDEPSDLSFSACLLIGLLHGIGVESPTQLLALGSAMTAGTALMGLSLVGLFATGMIVSNMLVAALAIYGFQSARRRNAVFLGLSILSAVFSAAIGIHLLWQ